MAQPDLRALLRINKLNQPAPDTYHISKRLLAKEGGDHYAYWAVNPSPHVGSWEVACGLTLTQCGWMPFDKRGLEFIFREKYAEQRALCVDCLVAMIP